MHPETRPKERPALPSELLGNASGGSRPDPAHDDRRPGNGIERRRYRRHPTQRPALCHQYWSNGRCSVYRLLIGGSPNHWRIGVRLCRLRTTTNTPSGYEPEVVFIVTNIDQDGRPRYPKLASDCLRAGAHVWIEKPPASSSAEIKEMIRVSSETKRYVAVGFKKMFFPGQPESERNCQPARVWPDYLHYCSLSAIFASV